MSSSDIIAHLAIVELEQKFAKTWDNGNAKKHARLYAKDATLKMAAAGDLPAATFRGQQSLSNFCLQTSQRFPGRHFIDMRSLKVNTQGNRAEAEIHFEFIYEGGPAEPRRQIQSVPGVYQSRYICERQQWRIYQRHMTTAPVSDIGLYEAPSLQ